MKEKEEKKGFFLSMIDTKNMSAADIETWEKIDQAIETKFLELGKESKKFWEGDVTPDEMVKKFEDVEKSLKDIEEKKLGYVDQKEFDKVVKDIQDNLVRFKAATKISPSGARELKSVEAQIVEQLKNYITEDKETGIQKVDLKAACMNSPGGKLPVNLVFTKAFLTTGAPNLAGVIVDPTIGVNPRPETFLRQFSNVANISARSIVIAQLNATGDAEWVPEGGLKPQMTGELTEKTITAGKVALFGKTSEEVLKDIPQLVAELRLEIENRVALKEEEGILYGTGTGGEIAGVMADIPEFSLTGIVVENPNDYDALVAVYTQIISTSYMNFRPNLAAVNPVDYANMQLSKDANGQYLRPYKVGDELIEGMALYATTAIDPDQFLVGDFRYLNIRDYVGYTVTFGWENDDFTKNMVTMIGEKRLLAYIKSNHLLAFVKGDFSTVKAAIEA